METDATLIDIVRHMIVLASITIAMLILPGLIASLLIALLQAATQVNESTLTFLPKLIVTLIVIVLLLPWLLSILTEYTQQLFFDIPTLIG